MVLFIKLARAVERRLGAFIALELGNMVWALAKALQSDAMVFAALPSAVDRFLGAEVLASTASASCSTIQSEGVLFAAALVREMKRRLGAFITQELAMTMATRGPAGLQARRLPWPLA